MKLIDIILKWRWQFLREFGGNPERTMSRISDQRMLAVIATMEEDSMLRWYAVRRLTVDGLLERIAKEHHADAHVRREAVNRRANSHALSDIARDDPDSEVRAAATAKLEDQGLISEIAGDDPSRRVRREAVKRLINQRLLAKIARKDGDATVRGASSERLTDFRCLERISRNDKSEEVRKAAVFRFIELSIQQAGGEIAYCESCRGIGRVSVSWGNAVHGHTSYRDCSSCGGIGVRIQAGQGKKAVASTLSQVPDGILSLVVVSPLGIPEGA